MSRQLGMRRPVDDDPRLDQNIVPLAPIEQAPAADPMPAKPTFFQGMIDEASSPKPAIDTSPFWDKVKKGVDVRRHWLDHNIPYPGGAIANTVADAGTIDSPEQAAMMVLPAGTTRMVYVPADIAEKFGIKAGMMELDTVANKMLQKNSKMKDIEALHPDVTATNSGKIPGRPEDTAGGSCVGCGVRAGECGNAIDPFCMVKHGLHAMAEGEARKANRLPPGVKTELRWQTNPKAAENDLRYELSQKKPEYHRSNDAGDMSEEEAAALADIAPEYPNTLFGVYTKNFQVPGVEELQNIENVSVIGSALGKDKPPAGWPVTKYVNKGYKLQPGEVDGTKDEWLVMNAIRDAKKSGQPMPTVVLTKHGGGAGAFDRVSPNPKMLFGQREGDPQTMREAGKPVEAPFAQKDLDALKDLYKRMMMKDK